MPTCKCKPKRGAPKNRRDRASLIAMLAGGGALLLLSAGYMWMLGGPTPPPTIGGAFELRAATGEAVTDRSFHGRYMLIYFGYTNCGDVCPTTLSTVDTALQSLGPRAANVQPIFISVDPDRDTPDVLGNFTAAFSPRLIGLTGTPAQIQAVQRAYRVTSVVHPSSRTPPDYLIDHSSVLYLVDPNGRYIAPIRADENAAEMASDIARHLS